MNDQIYSNTLGSSDSKIYLQPRAQSEETSVPKSFSSQPRTRSYSVSIPLTPKFSRFFLSNPESSISSVEKKHEKIERRPFIHPLFFETNQMHLIFELASAFLHLVRSKISYVDQKVPTNLYLQKQMGDSEQISTPRPILPMTHHSPKTPCSSKKEKDESPIPWIGKFLNGSFGAAPLEEKEKRKWSKIFHTLCGRTKELEDSEEEMEEEEERENLAKLSSYFEIAILIEGIGGECNRTPLGKFARKVDDHFKTVIAPIIEMNSLESSVRGYDLLTYRELSLISLEAWHDLYTWVEQARGSLNNIYELFGHDDYTPSSSNIMSPKELSEELEKIWKIIKKVRIIRKKDYLGELQSKMENLAERKIEALKMNPPKEDKGIQAHDPYERVRSRYSRDTMQTRLEGYFIIFDKFYQMLVNFEAFLKRYKKALHKEILETKQKIETQDETTIDFSSIKDYGAFGSPRNSVHKINITVLEAVRSRSTSRYIQIDPLLQNIKLLKKIAHRIFFLSEKSSAFKTSFHKKGLDDISSHS